MYIKVTNHISVSVDPVFLEDQSMPLEGHFIWAYQIWIENQGSVMVQLLSRTWRITDGKGSTHEIKGEGVIGETPWIAPGSTYHYVSGTPLPTPSGMMEGIYHMKTKANEHFDVVIPAFSLDSPYETAVKH
jgi:ApaG protein